MKEIKIRSIAEEEVKNDNSVTGLSANVATDKDNEYEEYEELVSIIYDAPEDESSTP